MEHEAALPVFFLEDPLTAVPDHGVKPGIMNAGEFAFRRIGYPDSSGEWLGLTEPALSHPHVLVIVGKLPLAAKIDPAVATKLGPWILRIGLLLGIQHA
jgi:hypothetical protein